MNEEWKNITFGLFAAEELTAADGTSIPADGLMETIGIDENGNAVTLDGTNAQTSPLIVATAIVNNIPPTDSWTKFKEDFRFIQPFSQDILESRGYSLAIVFSSSADGDFFQGAIGSTLCIDNVRIVCETEE